MGAPREIEALAAFVDVELAALRLLLEQEHKPIFPIWAEENAALAATTYEWAFGDGAATPTGEGLVLPFRCSLIALSLSLSGGAARAKVEVERDGVIESDYAIDLTASNQGFQEFFTPLQFSAGSVINFRTLTASGTAATNVVCAWMRKE